MANKRQECNRVIVKKIAELVEKHPDWRFHQILQNANVEICGQDLWYEEPSETLKRMVQTLGETGII